MADGRSQVDRSGDLIADSDSDTGGSDSDTDSDTDSGTVGSGGGMVDAVEVERRRADLVPRLEHLRARLAAAGGEHVDLLAVTKGHPVEAAIAARLVGLEDLGENYAQDLLAKTETVREQAGNVRWHFIGQLQTNKVRSLADRVAVWQSVDRSKVAREIAKRAPGATVFAQVNLSAASQKAGCSFDDLDQLVDQMRTLGLEVAGLMGVGTADDDAATAAGFARLRSAVDRLGLSHCSMGMSADLELAVGEGSTMVRVGTDLFGPRP